MNQWIPDETTILNFRHLLEKHSLGSQIFAVVSRHLQERGLRMQEGTIVDATIIKSPSSTKNKEKKRDHLLSKIRAKVEHPFRILKHLWGHTKTRYRGLKKNHNQLHMLFALSNLYRVRNRALQKS